MFSYWNEFNKDHRANTYYNILGVGENATTDQIVTEYKLLARKHHPDKNVTDINPEKFQQIQEAKDVLCDENLRRDYDTWLHSKVAMLYKQWRSMQDTMKTSLHWAHRNKLNPMIEGNSFQQQNSSVSNIEKDNFPSALDEWRAQASKNENPLLKKFRNYEV